MRNKPIELPEISDYLDIPLAPEWIRATENNEWRRRANALDDLLIEALAGAIASDDEIRAKTGEAILMLTAALEHAGDLDVASVEAAVFYQLTVHPQWRAAARQFFEKNRTNVADALRLRPGARLIYAVAHARRDLLPAGSAVLQ